MQATPVDNAIEERDDFRCSSFGRGFWPGDFLMLAPPAATVNGKRSFVRMSRERLRQMTHVGKN